MMCVDLGTGGAPCGDVPEQVIDDCETTEREVVVPSGHVGVIFYSPTSEGHMVKLVKEESPIFGEIEAGDVIASVDGEPTSKLDFNKIAELLMKKECNAQRVLVLKK